MSQATEWEGRLLVKAGLWIWSLLESWTCPFLLWLCDLGLCVLICKMSEYLPPWVMWLREITFPRHWARHPAQRCSGCLNCYHFSRRSRLRAVGWVPSFLGEHCHSAAEVACSCIIVTPGENFSLQTNLWFHILYWILKMESTLNICSNPLIA